MSRNRLRHKIEVMESVALMMGSLSSCKRLHVGCLIVTPSLSEILAIGYNGPPAGSPNDSCRQHEVGNCGCIHAEANALIKCRGSGVMIVTASPCEHCAGLIVNSCKITAVLYLNAFRSTTGIDVIERAHIPIVHTSELTDDRVREWWPRS